ncbi:hypothetical protein JOB18_011161 [Solea senegalensis]|uniref:Uncharacterized protein n=1 Tax=Solea senegalensis TaxID=28829 RepID=A0AAV6S0C3_SOLSE|nr:hypothetical protein JOB18_011161 [Solea senegalensis]
MAELKTPAEVVVFSDLFSSQRKHSLALALLQPVGFETFLCRLWVFRWSADARSKFHHWCTVHRARTLTVRVNARLTFPLPFNKPLSGLQCRGHVTYTSDSSI